MQWLIPCNLPSGTVACNGCGFADLVNESGIKSRGLPFTVCVLNFGSSITVVLIVCAHHTLRYCGYGDPPQKVKLHGLGG